MLTYTKEERLTLLTLTLVHRKWQYDTLPYEERRGYNIGALIVDENQVPISFAVNFVSPSTNTIQHAELLAIQQCLDVTGKNNLKGYTIYTTLEPCIMCLGTMVHSKITKLIYCQNDFNYAHSIKRLTADFSSEGEYEPYPDMPETSQTTLPIFNELNDAYNRYRKEKSCDIISKFLCTDIAEKIFAKAEKLFLEIGNSEDLDYLELFSGYKKPSSIEVLPENTSVKDFELMIKSLGKPSVFIGSSTEQLPLVEYIVSLFDPNQFIVHPWNKIFGKTLHAEGGTRSNLEWIKNFADIYDYGIFLFTEDDISHNERPRRARSVRHNVVFEFGLFFGRLGLSRSFIIKTENTDKFIYELFTDLNENINEFNEKSIGFKLQTTQFKSTDTKTIIEKGVTKVIQNTSLKDSVLAIENSIRNGYENVVYNFLPATALALGYFDSLLYNIVDLIDNIIDGNKTIDERNPVSFIDMIKNEISTIRFNVIMPEPGTNITNQYLNTILPDTKFTKERFYVNHWDRDVRLLKSNENTKILQIFDVPRTLLSSNQAIELINADPQIRTLLMTKEKRNFILTLQHKVEEKKANVALKIGFEVVFFDENEFVNKYL